MLEWIEQRIEEMLAAPSMWGTLEAVELQVLQLLELRALAVRPEPELANPRRVLELYQDFLRQRFPDAASAPLHLLAADLDLMRQFRDQLGQTSISENPFEHAKVAIRLRFDALPRMSAISGYYESFRRAARAVTSTRSGTGRRPKVVEAATDFTLEDVVLVHPNGKAGEALLRLGPSSGQADWDADRRVGEGLGAMLTLAEWAAGDEPVDQLALHDVEGRVRAALQARRLLPRMGITTAEIGGTLMTRSKPVELHASFDRRFVQVVAAHSSPMPFDRRDEIRAIDLDGGFLALRTGPKRSERVQCYVEPEQLAAIGEVGVRAHVTGLIYQPLGGRPFVLADRVDVEDDAGDLSAMEA
jgi:hypothetical protein